MVARRIALLAAVLLLPAVVRAAPADCAGRLLPAARAKLPDDVLSAQTLVELRDFGRTDSDVDGEPPFTLSPDGRHAALILRRANVASDDYCYGVVIVPLARRTPAYLIDVGGDPIPATVDIRGVPDIDSGIPKTAPPLWSADGRSLFYLRRDRGSTQLWKASLDGNAAKQITHYATDVLEIDWGIDHRTLLLVTRPSLAAGTDAIDREGRSGFRYDARYWPLSEDRPRPALPLPFETFALDVVSGRIRRLGGPNGRQRQAERPAATDHAVAVAVSSLGARAWLAPDDPTRLFPAIRLHVATAQRELPCAPAICGERVASLWWTGPGELVFVRAGSPDDGGTTVFYRWRIDREPAPRPLFATIDAPIGCQVGAGALICAYETARRPRRLVRLDLLTGRVTTMFDPNPDFAHQALGHVDRLSWRDGRGTTTYGDLVLPPGHRAGQRHPLVVVQYTSKGFLRGGTGDEYPVQLLAQRGMAVLSFQRPRGVAQRGQATDLTALQRLNVKDWTERRIIVSALHAGVDAAIARGAVDPDRLGISGMSDGATTTQFILNGANRFKAAAISSCCDEPSGLFVGGTAYRDAVLAWGYPHPGSDDTAFWKPMSLARNAGAMHTPLLIQEPDMEFRLSLEAVSALQLAGAPVEMYVFPDERHTKRLPVHRLAIYERSVDWFAYWLMGVRPIWNRRATEVLRWDEMRAALPQAARE